MQCDGSCRVPLYFGDPALAGAERDIYSPLEVFLHQGFLTELQARMVNVQLISSIIANGRLPGAARWEQPDLAAVVVKRSRFAATAHIELVSIEAKRSEDCDVRAVHQALAHKRFANKSYLAWNRSHCSCSDRDAFNRVFDSCKAHGVGLITVHSYLDPATIRVRLEAVSHSLPEDVVDEFINRQFDVIAQDKILSTLKKFCGGPI